LLRNLARARLAALRADGQNDSIERLPLLDFVPAVSPHLMRPNHLAPFAALLERACEPGQLRAVVAAPPQHGKTEMVTHGLLWLARRYPGRRHGYVTYSAERAEYVSAAFQRLAEVAGLEPEGRLSDVRLKGGTEIRFTSIGGSFTGFTVDGLLVIDDPFKDRADAESPTIRRKTTDWFVDVARSRRHPKTSILCMATRWHPEDLSGELIRRGYEYINLKAIAEGPVGDDGRIANDPLHRLPGESLFPELKPPSFFEEEQQDAYSWSSLYQGEPRGRGASVFEFPDLADPARTYNAIPKNALLRTSIGLDFAYTAKTHADWSVAVVLAAVGPVYYLANVVRLQVEPPAFRDRVKLLKETHPAARGAAYVASTELGGVEFIRASGLKIEGMSAAKAGDKFTRAIPVAAAWNSGKILLPKSAPWLDTFLAEVCGFTGVKDRHDDQVDAFAAAFDDLVRHPVRAAGGAVETGASYEEQSVGF
jgi:predicted phage terminase large subunit-like protein